MELLSYPWDNKEFYLRWLAQTYYYVRHSTRILALAAGRCQLTDVGQLWHTRFIDHLSEEHGHELLAYKDFLSLKNGHESIDLGPEFQATTALYRDHYYGSVYDFMGYVLALEETAAAYGPELAKTIEFHHGSGCTRFVNVHAKDDVGHIDEARKLVEMLSADLQTKVEQSRVLHLERYKAMLDACAEGL